MTKIKLSKVEAEGVLGEYKHKVEFSNSKPFVIIYGPNGIGKTKFLEIIYAASNINVRMLKDLPFRKVKLVYDDGTELSIAKTYSSSDDHLDGMKFILFDGSTKKKTHDIIKYHNNIGRWDEIDPFFEILARDLWEYMSSDEKMPAWEEMEKVVPEIIRYESDIKREFREFKSRTSAVLIGTQRLQSDPMRTAWDDLVESADRSTDRKSTRKQLRYEKPFKIADLSIRMKELIDEAEKEHSRITRKLDKTFPNRFLDQTTCKKRTVNEFDIIKRYNDLGETRKKISGVFSGLEDSDLPLPRRRKYEYFELQLLDLYLKDMEKKYSPFVSLLGRINIFENIISSRLLGKTIRVMDGKIVVTNSKTGRQIDLESLSSGEKHEIVMMYGLLFGVREGSIVLIDEPEISLHVAWQLRFIPDVRKIADATNFQFIVATHSPQIINDERDSAVRLSSEDM